MMQYKLIKGKDRVPSQPPDWLERNIAKAKAEGPFGTVGLLTAEVAEKLLAANPNNRAISPTNIARIGEDIKAGRWVMNGEPIIIDVDGRLNDGQHRCTAVALLNRAVETAFFFGASRESRLTVDTGNARQIGHFLHMQGAPNSTCVGAVCGYLICFAKFGHVGVGGEHRPTKAEMMEFWQTHQDVEDSVARVPTTTGKIGGRAILATTHFLFKRVDQEAADYVIDRFIHGDDMARNHPVHVAREYLIDRYTRAKAGDRSAKLSPDDKMELIVRAWDAYRKGRTVTRSQVTGRIPAIR